MLLPPNINISHKENYFNKKITAKSKKMLDKILLRVYDANTKLLLKVKQGVNYFYSLFCRMNTQWQVVQTNEYQQTKRKVI